MDFHAYLLWNTLYIYCSLEFELNVFVWLIILLIAIINMQYVVMLRLFHKRCLWIWLCVLTMKNIRVVVDEIDIFQIPLCIIIKFLTDGVGGGVGGWQTIIYNIILTILSVSGLKITESYRLKWCCFTEHIQNSKQFNWNLLLISEIIIMLLTCMWSVAIITYPRLLVDYTLCMLCSQFHKK